MSAGQESKKPDSSSQNSKLLNIQIHMKQVHERARSNAFAHRFAAEEYQKKAAWWFKKQIISGIFGILSVFTIYILSSSEHFDGPGTDLAIVGFTFSSVVLSLYSLYCSIFQNYLGYERLAQLHEHNQHSYLYICQRAREVTFSQIQIAKAESIREDIERDFQILKARGKEPSDEHFKAGDELLEGLKTGKEASRQSFSDDLLSSLYPDTESPDGNQS